MNRKLALIMALTLLVAVLTVTFNMQRAKASGPVYIRADGGIDPPDAPITTIDNVTYTLTGNINDSIVIERDSIVVDGAGHTVQGTGSGVGMRLSERSNVTICNSYITYFLSGIELYSSNNITVTRNNITNNEQGIWLDYSSNNSISGNNITANSWCGIFLGGSSGNIIAGNIFADSGLVVDNSYGNIVENNLVNDKPLVYLEGASHRNVGEAGQVILVSCEYIRVENLNLSHTTTGLHLLNTNNTIIFGNNITANKCYGIELSLSSNNTLFGNNVTANNADGIYLSGSFNNTLSGNKIANNYDGMHLIGSSNNSIIGNAMPANGADGINLEYSSNSNSIFGNNVSNSRFGILLEYSCNHNIVSENNATSNNWYGIGLCSSSNNNTVSKNIMITNGDACLALSESSENKIYHNNFISNAEQVQISPGYANVWDDGYPSGGNYWSDYTGVDDYGGHYQNETGSDGIGDTSYVIDASNQDRYPFMQPRIPIALPVYDINTGLGYVTIQAAINAANSGDTISVKEGTYYEQVVINKSITLTGENRDRTIIDGTSNGTAMNITANHTNVTGFTIQKSGPTPDCGVYLSSSFNNISYNIIRNCPAYYIGYAIELQASSNNIISGNIITSNPMTAVLLYNSSNNVISENNITDNEYGIGLSGSDEHSSSNNTIFGNRITNNSETGISLYRSPGNIISQNSVTNNKIGIDTTDYPSSNTTICENDIANNTKGISLISSGNKIYHNNFIGNTQQAYLMLGANSQDVWDDDYTSGGNYWSDYTGTDANSDGIGDSPYLINDNNRDRYPLVNNWTPNWTPSNHVPPVTPNVQVGVKSGDWIKVDYTVTGAPSGTTLPLWLKVEFLSVEGTNATARVTMRMSDGTEQNATVPVDVVTGGQALGLSGFVIPANATTGDSVYMSGYGNVTVAGETTRSYAGASRTVVYASFSQYGTQLTYYWDKQTGVLVEATVVSGSMTATGKTTETNMWQAGPSGLPIEPIYLYILAALAIIVAIGTAAFLVRRKRKPPEEVENSHSKLQLTRAGFRRSFGHRITRV
jgi:parallel beta-helix repeat protein